MNDYGRGNQRIFYLESQLMEPNQAIENLIADIQLCLDKSVMVRSEAFETENSEPDEDEPPNSLQTERNYFSIDPPVYGLFNKVVKSFDAKKKLRSIELISFSLDQSDLPSIEILANHLYEILKNHTIGQGKFNPSDVMHFNEGVEWQGKLWTDYESGSIISLSMKSKIANLIVIYYGGT